MGQLVCKWRFGLADRAVRIVLVCLASGLCDVCERRNSRTGWPLILGYQKSGPPCPTAALMPLDAQGDRPASPTANATAVRCAFVGPHHGDNLPRAFAAISG